jgi:hypothetical protein
MGLKKKKKITKCQVMPHFHFGGVGPSGSSNSNSSHLNFTQPDKSDLLANEHSQINSDLDYKYQVPKPFKHTKTDRDDVEIEFS